MLETVDIGVQSIRSYESSAGSEVVEELRELARPLQGARILHLNATPYGGGVAEILRSEIPLLRDLGLVADWKVITGNEEFFSVTKTIHNGLQGAKRELTPEEQEIYLAQAALNSQLLEEQYDLVVVHDPQPLALLAFEGRGDSQWIWRCHIDTSEPNPQIFEFLRPYFTGYDAAVFTLGSFVPPNFPLERIEIIPPAIDPESPKNIKLTPELSQRVLDWIGVETQKPLITQVSRFDPWKDHPGVIKAYQIVKKKIPDLQLALVGSMALDDPEGWEIYRQIQEEARGDQGIHVFTNLNGVGNIEVNAFQRLSKVVIQKSLREGFGLVISEALWKETPVVAGRAGGIPLQVPPGVGGFLVDSIEECAERIFWLLTHPKEAAEMGLAGHWHVRERFLLTRLIADELRLYADLLSKQQPLFAKAARAGLSGEVRDPVCGVRLNPKNSLTSEYKGERYFFCSPSCQRQFHEAPEYFLRAVTRGKGA